MEIRGFIGGHYVRLLTILNVGNGRDPKFSATQFLVAFLRMFLGFLRGWRVY